MKSAAPTPTQQRPLAKITPFLDDVRVFLRMDRGTHLGAAWLWLTDGRIGQGRIISSQNHVAADFEQPPAERRRQADGYFEVEPLPLAVIRQELHPEADSISVVRRLSRMVCNIWLASPARMRYNTSWLLAHGIACRVLGDGLTQPACHLIITEGIREASEAYARHQMARPSSLDEAERRRFCAQLRRTGDGEMAALASYLELAASTPSTQNVVTPDTLRRRPQRL